MERQILILFLLPLLVFGSEPAAEEVSILRIIDGDTVLIEMPGGAEERLRIIGIDTPEIVAHNRPVECFGSEASAYAQSLLGATSTLDHTDERDRYERRLGYLETPDGLDFGLVMITDGYAYAYRSFSHERLDEYIAAEAQARENQVGLWHPNACSDFDRDAGPGQNPLGPLLKTVLDIIIYLKNLFI